MKVILTALGGILKSNVIEVDDRCYPVLYFAHMNKLTNFCNEIVQSHCEIKKMQFEPTGRTFKDKTRKPIYEFTLTEI